MRINIEEKKLNDKIVFKGKLELIEQEGGYASPQLWIGTENVTISVWEYFDGNEELFKAEGEWELTLRKIK